MDHRGECDKCNRVVILQAQLDHSPIIVTCSCCGEVVAHKMTAKNYKAMVRMTEKFFKDREPSNPGLKAVKSPGDSATLVLKD